MNPRTAWTTQSIQNQRGPHSETLAQKNQNKQTTKKIFFQIKTIVDNIWFNDLGDICISLSKRKTLKGHLKTILHT